MLQRLADAGLVKGKTPTRADLARLDRKRKKKGANDDWTHPHDPDAKITRMKDGRTHLAHKAEHESAWTDDECGRHAALQPARRADADDLSHEQWRRSTRR
jgi:hypothetical protein